MPLPSGIGFPAAGGATGAGGGVTTGAGGAVVGGAVAGGAVAGAVAASVGGDGATVVVGGSAASGDGPGGTSLNWSPPARAAAVSSRVGEAGRPRAVATPTVSTTSDRNRIWKCRGRPESMRRGMDCLLSG